MKTYLVLISLVEYCLTLPVDFDLNDEDDIYKPECVYYQSQNGTIQTEFLNTSTIQAYPKVHDMTFYFFNKENSYSGVEIKESQLHNILKLTQFNVHKETLVVIHGWKNNFESAINDIIKSAALSVYDINVIIVDWSPIAKKNYVTAKNAVAAVGEYVGRFLLKLKFDLNHSLSRITVVGHSLGAHIAGNIGATTGGKINNIIGMDPAGPLFSKKDTSNRLDPTDAKFVQVIHTNDGILGFGIRMGHVDIYPNGGRSQAGCGLDLFGTCAHSRAYKYYAESLVSNKFVSWFCSSYSNFEKSKCHLQAKTYMGGFPVQRSGHYGEYFLHTNKNTPFAQGA